MDVRSLARAASKGSVDQVWVPFQREMAPLEPYHPLADDIRENGLTHPRGRLDDGTETFLAVAGDGYAGVVSVERESQPLLFERGPDLHVSERFVRESHRRSGVGTALLDRCTARGEEWGVKPPRWP